MHIRETILEYAGSANLSYIKSQALINHKRIEKARGVRDKYYFKFTIH